MGPLEHLMWNDFEARRGDEEEKVDEGDNTGDPAAAIVNIGDAWCKSMVVKDSSVELVVRGWRMKSSGGGNGG